MSQGASPDRLPIPEEDSIGVFAGTTLFSMILLIVVLPYIARFWTTSFSPNSSRERLTEDVKISIRGIGPIRIGMTPEEAASIIGDPLSVSEDWGGTSESCYYVKPEHGPEGIYFMVIGGRIERVDIANSQISSRSGARVGSSEDLIHKLFAGRLEVEGHADDEGGRSLVFTPRDESDRSYRMIFDTNGGEVTMIRAGRIPAVQYVEGCL
ncbi:MAG TPA: hypothetical protein VKM72_35830 [Thermoanaerobaculia bacterium]|nr:hypothetical protein [Thermoanaerobaculia bacterium]